MSNTLEAMAKAILLKAEGVTEWAAVAADPHIKEELTGYALAALDALKANITQEMVDAAWEKIPPGDISSEDLKNAFIAALEEAKK